MATDIVRDVELYAYSPNSKWAWAPSRKHPNGRAREWRWGTLRICEARTPAGFLCFRAHFPNGKHFNAETLAQAQEYAEANAVHNSK